ncbi:DUF1005 domain-containing protein [Cinnamomum micranthum f. kanehirae]|uniref:DUF1005 domain-containing protein n=1 Tax=Cinnamomum micranthum f. kanehirae TaxID=337451 RepID=A0A443N4T5_9MAGN|nr:DUF1005 domain-containing protein [Cinnamomum micranthum f. kanehirae]
MEPCPFVRILVESLSLKLPIASKPAGSGIHPSTTPCFCKIRLKNFPSQTALLPLDDSPPTASSAVFQLDPDLLRRISARPTSLRVSVYTGRMGTTCGVRAGKLLGHVTVGVDLGAEPEVRAAVFQSGWVAIGREGKPSAKLHLVVRSEPDPRFVFQFGGEPECSPVVFQIQGNIRQPLFSCKFSADRNSRSRSLPLDYGNNSRGWLKLNSLGSERERQGRERKGWMIMIHDLSGSPIAAASMITPFVPSPGSDRVSRSNPGVWLILRAHGVSVSSWKPWARLEAWRERGPIDSLGYKLELVTDNSSNSSIPIAESTLSVRKGGQFRIDTSKVGNFVAGSWPSMRGFVMGSTVKGERKVSKPMVQVGVKHVTCMADAAVFIALSAAIDLSMDACQLFAHKLRKELCHDQKDYIL